MTRALCDVTNVSPKDIGCLVNNTEIGVGSNATVTDRSIVLYDKTPGSLFFSNKAYHQMDKVMGRMIDLSHGDNELTGIVSSFIDWYGKLKPVKVPTYEQWQTAGLKQHANENSRQPICPAPSFTGIRRAA